MARRYFTAKTPETYCELIPYDMKIKLSITRTGNCHIVGKDVSMETLCTTPVNKETKLNGFSYGVWTNSTCPLCIARAMRKYNTFGEV